jgi:hypothetical protein
MDKNQKYQNRIVKKTFMWLAVVLIAFLLFFYISGELKKIRYNGVEFNVIKEGQLTFYQTTLPFPFNINSTKTLDYNFYLRTNPNELKNVPFNGNLSIKKKIVFNPNDELNCDGDGVIAVANLIQNLYGYLNASVIRDEKATCDSLGRYSLITMKVSNVTEINQIGNSCYEIKVANCEVLKGTERYMLEAFVKIKEVLNKKN